MNDVILVGVDLPREFRALTAQDPRGGHSKGQPKIIGPHSSSLTSFSSLIKAFQPVVSILKKT
jgi:hypothetical protein